MFSSVKWLHLQGKKKLPIDIFFPPFLWGLTLKGKKLLPQEQILSFKSSPIFKGFKDQGRQSLISEYSYTVFCLFVCLSGGFMAQSTKWGHIECGKFTWAIELKMKFNVLVIFYVLSDIYLYLIHQASVPNNDNNNNTFEKDRKTEDKIRNKKIKVSFNPFVPSVP